MNYKEIFIQILTILGVLSIPSIIWNIFLYRQNKKYKKWGAERDLKKLNAQRRKIESEFENKDKKLVEDYENGIYHDFDTYSEKCDVLEKKRGLLYERKNNTLDEIDADIDYFEKF